MALKLLRKRPTLDRIGVSNSRLYEMIAAGEFPKPVQLGERAVAWLESEVDAWIEAKVAERDQRAA